jgi:hypothetical protein
MAPNNVREVVGVVGDVVGCWGEQEVREEKSRDRGGVG